MIVVKINTNMILRISLLAFCSGVASLSLRELNLRPGAVDRLATRAKLAECNEKAPDDSAVKIYERDAQIKAPDNVVVFSANEDDAAARCVDVFLRNDGSYGFDDFRRGDGQGWTPTLPDFYSRDKFASAAEARAEARAAIPWFEAWEEGADVLDASKLSDEEIPCCSEMKYCGASPAALNVAAAMGFNYAYEGFGI